METPGLVTAQAGEFPLLPHTTRSGKTVYIHQNVMQHKVARH